MSSTDGSHRPPLRIVPPSGANLTLTEGKGTLPPDTGALVRRAAERAASRSFYLAPVLERYRLETDQDEDQLVAMLGCARDALPKLALCRAPEAASEGFRQEVEAIAALAGARASALAQILRFVSSLSALRESLRETGEPGGLLAARDRDGETPPEPVEPR
jgi:hypothetical protein